MLQRIFYVYFFMTQIMFLRSTISEKRYFVVGFFKNDCILIFIKGKKVLASCFNQNYIVAPRNMFDLGLHL